MLFFSKKLKKLKLNQPLLDKNTKGRSQKKKRFVLKKKDSFSKITHIRKTADISDINKKPK